GHRQPIRRLAPRRKALADDAQPASDVLEGVTRHVGDSACGENVALSSYPGTVPARSSQSALGKKSCGFVTLRDSPLCSRAEPAADSTLVRGIGDATTAADSLTWLTICPLPSP